MRICGWNKTTLLDYPGHMAATIFTGGCNMRCPFCHNKGLVLEVEQQPVIEEEEVLRHLERRRGILTGLCITGGEPTLQPDLEEFIRKVRRLGILVKLDTNGTRPRVLERLLRQGLLDYVAMDIKASGEHYGQASGVEEAAVREAVEESAELLKAGSIDYEFRTTLVKGLHRKEEMEDIGRWLAGAKAYYLQNYQGGEHILSGRRDLEGFSLEELREFERIAQKYIDRVAIRGVSL